MPQVGVRAPADDDEDDEDATAMPDSEFPGSSALSTKGQTRCMEQFGRQSLTRTSTSTSTTSPEQLLIFRLALTPVDAERF